MKKDIFIHKKIFTFMFLTALFAFFTVNLIVNGEKLQNVVSNSINMLNDGKTDIRQAVAAVDTALTDDLLGKMELIETYSMTQNILDKREINNFDFIKDETGSLHYSAFYRDEYTNCFEYALHLKRMHDYAEQFGTKVMFVVPPSKYTTGETQLRTGLSPNDPSGIVNEMMFYLNRMGIETLELGKYIPNQDVSYEDTFFRTDHHWTIPAAFEATRILTQKLNERFGFNLDADKYLDPSMFDKIIYRGGMLGSMGRKTGACFSGVDDFTALYPKFQMNFYRKTLEENGNYTEREGNIIGTLIMPDVLMQNNSIYNDSQYSLYLNGLRTYESIINKTDSSGPSVFMIRDSYFSPVISFMAPMCSRIDAMWSLEERPELDIEQYIRDNRFDLIIMEIYPFNISDDAFRYFED